MMEFIGEFIAAVVEVVAWVLLEVVRGVGLVLWIIFVTVRSLLVGLARLIRRLFVRKDEQRELVLAILEYHEAVADVRRIGADAKRQIRAMAKGRRR
jgi:hypothetical protein